MFIKDSILDMVYSKRNSKGLTNYERNGIKRLLFEEAMGKASGFSLAIVFLHIVLIFVNTMDGFYANEMYGYSCLIINIICLIVSAIFPFISNKIKDKEDKYKSILLGSYYFVLALGMLFLIFGDSYRNPSSFSVAIFYLIVFASVPHPFYIYNVYLYGLIMLGIVVDNFIIYAMLDTSTDFGVYLLLTFICYLMTNYILSSTIKQHKLNFRIRELNTSLEVKSFSDQLTQALNRYALETFYNSNIEKWYSDNIDVGIIMYDIDNFKCYNDNNSHLAGDDCLKLITDCVKSLCNKNMENVYRYGGDEFIILTVGINDLQLLEKALEIKHECENMDLEERGFKGKITVSMGCVKLDLKEGIKLDDCILLADKQLYNAKNNNKNCISINNHIYR